MRYRLLCRLQRNIASNKIERATMIACKILTLYMNKKSPRSTLIYRTEKKLKRDNEVKPAGTNADVHFLKEIERPGHRCSDCLQDRDGCVAPGIGRGNDRKISIVIDFLD